MVLAAVVSRLASTKSVRQVAYATATTATRRLHPLRASRLNSRMATAATPDRSPAICHPVKSAALMAAPPVEKRTAAAMSWRRATVREGMGQDNHGLSSLARHPHLVADHVLHVEQLDRHHPGPEQRHRHEQPE